MQHKRTQQGLRIGGLLATVAAASLLVGCGSMSTDLAVKETLAVVMTGVFESPADAIGNAEPKSLAFTLEDVTATTADGTVLDLYDADPVQYVIISRAQIVAEAELTEYVDEVITALTVTFAADVVGKGKYDAEMTTTLTSASAIYQNTFTIEKAKAMQLDVNVQWKGIVTRDEEAATETMSSPAFVAELGDES